MIRAKKKYLLRAFWVIVVICTGTFVFAQSSSERPAYKPLRYDEDWSPLADESKREDYADRLKYISLGKENWYLTIGGEFRPRYEFYKNENFSNTSEDDNGYLLQRYLLHADWHLGKKLRVFSQLQSSLVTGRSGGARATDRDRTDINQFFVDYHFLDKKNKSLLVRAGRQEIQFGTGKLVNVRDGLNSRQTFDGIRLSAKLNKWTLDAFAVKPVKTDGGFFDDKAISGQTFGGFYATRPLKLITKNGGIDVYYLVFDRQQARFNQGTEREIRHSFGTRIWNAKESFDYNYEFIYQFGKFGRDGQINAWTAATENGYTFEKAFFKPRLSLKANITSGDKNPKDKDLQTFNALFPSGAYFGYLSPIGPYNHFNLHPTANFKITDRFNLFADYNWFWRTSLDDGVYAVPGILLRSSSGSRKRFVGRQFDAVANYKLDSHTTLTTAFGRFLVGGFLRDAPPARDTTYFSSWITYKF